MLYQYFKLKNVSAAVTSLFLAHTALAAINPEVQSPPAYQLAMMDNMNMGGMPAKDPAKMNSGMPMNDPMQSAPSGSMQAPAGMDMMGRMRGSMQNNGMSPMPPAGQLPGFPGASHLYHIGATDFFLDHPDHISLSIAQQTSLNRIKEKTLLDGANTERRIEDAEQELWTLTAADSPDGGKIESKVQAIEKLRSNQRMAFIRAVGEAGKILTADQRAALLGTKPITQPSTNKPMPSDPPMPDKPMAPMSDM